MITDKWPILNSILLEKIKLESKTQTYFKMPRLNFGIASLSCTI